MSNLPDEGARNFLYKYAKKHYWRVAAWIDFDDLIQDGYAAYAETLYRYPTAKNAAHIQSLFQLVFRSKIEDLVRANTKQVDDARSDIVEIFDSPELIIPDVSNLQALLAKAPDVIKDALNLLMSDSLHVLAQPFKKDSNGCRETLNERFCRLMQRDPKEIDVVTLLRTYFAVA